MIWWFIVPYAVILIVLVCAACAFASDEWDTLDDKERVEFARACLLIPVWPIALVGLIVYGFIVLLDQARLGDLVQKKDKEE